jgi:iron complex outermembrane recepter protein
MRVSRQKFKHSYLSGVSLLTLSINLFALTCVSQAQENTNSMPGMHHADHAAGGATPSGDISAQGSGQVDDVVIMGNSPGDKLMDEVMMQRPRSGDVVTGATIDNQEIRTLNELSQLVPSFRPNTTSPRQSRMAIRGIGTGASGGTGSASSTGYFVDNVYWGFAGWSFGNVVDLDAFEIQLGPTGTDGGKNTNVGAVRFHTKLPSFTQSTTLETSFSSYNNFMETIVATGPLIDEHLAYRVTLYGNRGDGWINNYGSAGGALLDANRAGARVQLLGVGDGFTDRLIFTYKGGNEHSNYLTGTIGDTTLKYNNGVLYTGQTFFQRVAARLHAPILTTNAYKPYLARNNTAPLQIFQLTNEANIQWGENTFTSISAGGYGSWRNNDFSDNQNLQYGFGTGNMDTFGNQFSQEFRLTSPKDRQFEWTVGLYSFAENLRDEMHHATAGADTAAFYGQPALLAGAVNKWYTKAKDYQIAAYGQGTWHFDEHLAVTAGLRESYEMRYGSSQYVANCVASTKYTCQQQAAAMRAVGYYGNVDSGGFTNYHNGVVGIFNPQYKFNENVQIYALIGYGDKSPSVNTQATPVFNAALTNIVSWAPLFTKPETSIDYEIGFKASTPDMKFTTNVNFYWNDIHNYQSTATRVLQVGGLQVLQSYLGNVPQARLQGVEFVNRWEPIEHLTFHLTGAYNGFFYVAYPDAPAPADYPLRATIASRSNSRVEGIPPVSIAGGVSYEQPLGFNLHQLGDWADLFGPALRTAPLSWRAYADFDWYSRVRLTSPLAYNQYWQGAYTIVNLGVGIQTDDKKYSLSFWAKNILNAQSFTSWAGGSSTAPTLVGISTMGPRTVGGTLFVTF